MRTNDNGRSMSTSEGRGETWCISLPSVDCRSSPESETIGIGPGSSVQRPDSEAISPRSSLQVPEDEMLGIGPDSCVQVPEYEVIEVVCVSRSRSVTTSSGRSDGEQ